MSSYLNLTKDFLNLFHGQLSRLLVNILFYHTLTSIEKNFV
ncbi:MAG: hypothetical protein JKY73_01910 [Lutibacter sp.]|nr:hypothetical protein [Lutibacter sp.]